MNTANAHTGAACPGSHRVVYTNARPQPHKSEATIAQCENAPNHNSVLIHANLIEFTAECPSSDNLRLMAA